ncbi:hypothetical protein LX83_000702 [Goodfellowiella coeruleoviolacea]|uniref:DUF1877 family protein n=1 Tax=Goodfellowiella coeruleoviolacea TaxID=334858 RepID=A0AAE3G8Z2_9PSEU|nr:hypothetical protein [Goodfellowiella coeruleoviolacea]
MAELHKLCSYRSAPRSDHLDLDWWPVVLRRLGEPPEHAHLSVLRRAFDGHDEVNPAYRDHPTTVWEHPVTALEPDAVGVLAAELCGVTPQDVGAAAVLSGRADTGFAGLEPETVTEHVVRAFGVLRDFYAEAASRRMAVVLWWD